MGVADERTQTVCLADMKPKSQRKCLTPGMSGASSCSNIRLDCDDAVMSNICCGHKTPRSVRIPLSGRVWTLYP